MSDLSPTPAVSVIVIFLDAAAFLEEAIRSVFAQSTDDWELLLVDDGSSDGSTDLARGHAAAHPGRVRYLEHEGHRNLGKSASRNLGADAARGSYLCFLDADDVLLDDALATLAAALRAEPRAAMSYGPLEYWYSWAEAPYRDRADFIQPLGVPTGALIEPPALLTAFLRRRAAAPSGMLVRADVVRAVGGFERAFGWMYEDQVFCAKICLGWPVLTIGATVYRYRQHAASSSAVAQRSGEHDFGRLAFLEWLEAYLRGRAISGGPVWRALRSELWWARHPRLGRLRKATRRRWRRLLRARTGPRPAATAR